MSGKRILAVFGDQGGFNAGMPVLHRAMRENCQVSLYLVGPCRKLYAEGKLNAGNAEVFTTDAGGRSSTEFFFEHDDLIELLVVGASNSAEGVRDSLRAIADNPKCPILIVEDMYGSSLPLIRQMDQDSLQHLTVCVMDEFAREMILREFLKLDQQVIVTGGPQFDKVVEMKRRKTWEERKQILHNALGGEDRFVFLIAGGLNGTDEILQVLEGGIEAANLHEEPIVILRNHPRATDEDKQRMLAFLGQTKHRSWFKDVSRELAPTSDDLLPVADFVLSGYSTTNHFGILCEMPGVVYVGTPAFRADHLREKGTEVPPQVKAGAGWYVQRPEEMAAVISMKALNQYDSRFLKLREAQERIAQYNKDGRAADRVWQQMQRLIA